MKIIVLIKQVPDTWGERRLVMDVGVVDRAVGEAVLDEIGERVLDVAIKQAEATGGTVTVLTMGPQQSSDALRKALAIGADDAIHVLDDELAGADIARTAAVLASVIGRNPFDLILCGDESTDGRGGVVPAMVSEHLGVPHLTSLDALTIHGSEVRGDRRTDDGVLEAVTVLPAVISITERAAEPRFPTFRGIMKAKKKPFETVTLGGLIDVASIEGGRSVVLSAIERPARTAGRVVADDGSAASELADFLFQNRLV